jgi:hypothetical protein
LSGPLVATVESCTGGALACLLADAEGAGDVSHGGFVVYTKAAKSAAVGVPPMPRSSATWQWRWRAGRCTAFQPMSLWR